MTTKKIPITPVFLDLPSVAQILDKADAGGCSADWHSRRGRRALPVGDDLVGGKWRWLG